MATLPDGTTVNSQYGPEGWEDIGVSFPNQQFPTEGWESPIFVMGEFTATPDSQTVAPGEAATVSGEAVDETGNNLGGGVPFTCELRDGDGNVVDSASGTTDPTGYSAEVTPPTAGTFQAVTVNKKIGRQAPTEGWEDNVFETFNSQFGPEGWET